jgi:hypothetical protein
MATKAKRIEKKKSAATKPTKKSATKKVASKRTIKKSSIKKNKKKPSKKLGKKPATKRAKPEKKSMWKLSPQSRNSVRELWVFQKDGVTIGLNQIYGSSFVIVDQKPDLANYDPDRGISIHKFEFIDHEEVGGPGPDWRFPDDFPLEKRADIMKLWDAEYDDGMRKAGWVCECDTFFTGPLLIEEVKVDLPHNPV